MSSWELSRRHFLRGSGLLLGLPLLDAMLPGLARAQIHNCSAIPQRMVFCFNPNGMVSEYAQPSVSGTGWWNTAIPQTLIGLQEHNVLSDVTVVTGMQNILGQGLHGLDSGAALTCSLNEVGSQVTVDDSVDQVYASACPHLPRRSMQLGLRPASLDGSTQTYPTALKGAQSYKDQVALPIQLPHQAFQSLFGTTDPTESEEAFEKRRLYNRSVLDFVKDDANSLKTRLGVSDKRRMDEYMEGLFELDMRLQAEVYQGAFCDPGFTEANMTFFNHPYDVDLVQDIIVQALRCDLTRSISFMRWGVGASDGILSYGFVTDPNTGGPITDQYHNVSHYGFTGAENQAWKDICAAIEQWEVREFAKLCSKLKAIPEGNGTLLDNCAIVHYTTMGNSQYHIREDLNVLIGGGLGGTLPTGTHVPAPGEELASLWLALLQKTGVGASSFGRLENGSAAATAPLAL